MSFLHALMAILGFAGLGISACYSFLTLLAVLVWRRNTASVATAERPSVTLLKPLCGAEPGLYEHLRGFCEQD